MKARAFQQYQSESSNWLKAGRCELLAMLMERHCGRERDLRILEIGAGVGQNVAVLSSYGVVDVLEIDPLGLAALRGLEGVNRIFDQPIPSELPETYDVIVAFDVLEHLEDDVAATQWVAAHLNNGGHFIAAVPAYQWLFSDHDLALEHFRRYTKRGLVNAMAPELTVVRAGYFVCLLFPIAASMRLLGRAAKRARSQGPTQSECSKQSASVPRVLDSMLRRELSAEIAVIKRGRSLPFGLSAIAVAKKSVSRLP